MYHKPSEILFGGDYNPDQWDDTVIEQDMRYFKEAGINLVILPVFSWAKLEPSEGVYSFEWLDQILDKIWENGIHFCLATPTVAQPAWLSKQYPEVLPVDISGRKRTHGMRVFFCYNSLKYRERAAAIAEEMAKRYGNHPGLAAWHVANEYGTYCYCENCQQKFRLWLKKRYGTVENLNEKWHNSFWGRTVYSFDEVYLPTELNDDYRFNPVRELDYQRFVTDSTLECFENEARVLQRYTPDVPVFSNISGHIKKLDQFKMVSKMDYAGFDNYPHPTDPRSLPAMKLDLMRGLKDGKSFLVAEQSPNQQNWQPYNKLKRPGEVRLLAYQGMAHGSDSALYFQMRQSLGGQEKFHGALISHAGTDDTRIFRELAQMGKELKGLGDTFLEGTCDAKVGFLFDWDNWWALELASGPTKDMDYLWQMHHYYRAFYEYNVPIDILRVTADFEKYKVLVAPLLYMMKEGVAQRLERFVERGGTLIATYMTGVTDENDRCVFGAYPGPLRKTMGLWVEETDALFPDEENEMILNSWMTQAYEKSSYGCTFLCDRLRLETAEPLAYYGKDFYAGEPCLTVNRLGSGKAYYLASQPEEAFVREFAEKICREQGVEPLFPSEGEIELTKRNGRSGEIWFALNHGKKSGYVDLGEKTYQDLLTGKRCTGKLVLESRDVAVLKREQ